MKSDVQLALPPLEKICEGEGDLGFPLSSLKRHRKELFSCHILPSKILPTCYFSTQLTLTTMSLHYRISRCIFSRLSLAKISLVFQKLLQFECSFLICLTVFRNQLFHLGSLKTASQVTLYRIYISVTPVSCTCIWSATYLIKMLTF